MQISIQSIIEWIYLYKINLILSFLIILLYVFLLRIILPKIEKNIERDYLKKETLISAVFSIKLFSRVIVLILILFIWGFNFRGLLALSTSLIAITGVALFANWSILSNVTAFFLLLAHKSYQRGNFIRVLDVDNYIEAYISDINLFNTRLVTEDKEVLIYPNNLLIARPVIVNSKKRYSVVGKTDEFAKPSTDE